MLLRLDEPQGQLICFLQICQEACLGFSSAGCTKGMAAMDGGADASFLSMGCAALLLCLAEVCTTVLTVLQAYRSGSRVFPQVCQTHVKGPWRTCCSAGAGTHAKTLGDAVAVAVQMGVRPVNPTCAADSSRQMPCDLPFVQTLPTISLLLAAWRKGQMPLPVCRKPTHGAPQGG